MFSEEQLSFITNQSNFVLKTQVDHTVNKLLYTFQNTISDLIDETKWSSPTKLSKLPGKVTKGNNHKGFPFQVSDYPSTFNGKNTFSFRSTIWYGHFFSFSLVLSGKPKENYSIDLKKLADKGYQLVVDESIWEVDPNSPSIDISMSEIRTITEVVKKSHAFRVFKTYELNHIYDFERLGVECFKEFFYMN